MNLREELLRDYSKQQSQKLSVYIGDKKERMAELMTFYSDSDPEISKRAAWVLQHVHDLFPEQSDPYQALILKTLQYPNTHDAVKRAGLRTLADKHIEEENLGIAAEICFKLLNSLEEPVAIKVHSMEILKNIVKRIPELKEELLFSIEEQFPYQTSGFKNRASKILTFLIH